MHYASFKLRETRYNKKLFISTTTPYLCVRDAIVVRSSGSEISFGSRSCRALHLVSCDCDLSLRVNEKD